MLARELDFCLPPQGPTVEHIRFRNEDGTNWRAEKTRQFFIEDQNHVCWSDFQEWSSIERMDLLMM